MGLYPPSELLLVPFGIGTTLASFHSLGNFPVEMDKFMSLDSNKAMLLAVDFNIFGDIPSQPVDLVVSRLANKSNTDSSVDSR